MVYTSTQPLAVKEFLVRYGDNPRYELVDGELIDMDPTGPYELVSGKISTRLGREIDRLDLSWVVPKSCMLRPFDTIATARRPDATQLLISSRYIQIAIQLLGEKITISSAPIG